MGYCAACLLVAILMVLSLMQASAMRPLAGEDWVMQKGFVVQSLQRGSVPSSGASACTYIAGSGRGRCTLEQQNSVAAADHHDSHSSFPNVAVEFGITSVINETAK